MNRVLAIILGGGRGTRLWPLTQFRSKPAVPIGGKYRLIDIPISNCLHAGIRSMYVLTQFNSASLNRHIAQTYRFDSFSRGFVDVLAAEQTEESADWYQGTADAVRQQVRHFSGNDFEQCLVLSGDHLYRMDYREFVVAHRQRQADLTIAVKPVSREAAPELGILKTDAKGRIVDFVEKPQTDAELDELATRDPDGEPRYLASMGIYVFERGVLADMLEADRGDDFGKHIIPRTIKERRVFAHAFPGYWEDIGTIRAFYRTNLMLAEPNAPFTFYDAERPIYTHPRNLAASRIEDCRLSRAKVADGCLIEAKEIRHSIIGVRSVIGSGTCIEDSILMGADYYESGGDRSENRESGRPAIGIGSDCEIRGAIIDKNARIGDGVRILNRAGLEDASEGMYAIRDGIVVVPKGAVIPSGTEI